MPNFITVLLKKLLVISLHDQIVLDTGDILVDTIIYCDEQLACNLFSKSTKIIEVDTFRIFTFEKILAESVNLVLIKFLL